MTGKRRTRFARGIVAAILLTGVALGPSPAAFAAEMRTWTDDSGQFQVEARFVRVEGDTVLLQRKNGAKLQIELKKLSVVDQRYIRENAARGEDLFSSPGGSAGGGRADQGPSRGNGAPGAVNWLSAKIISALPKGRWEFPEPAPSREGPAGQQTVILPPNRGFDERNTTLVVNPDCHRAVVGYVLEKAQPDMVTRVVLCDLEGGRSVERFGPGKMLPLALSAAGNQVLMRSNEFGFGKSGCLELWKLTSTGVERGARWTPHEDGWAPDRDIKWAAFVDEGRLITLSTGGILAVWQLAPLAPLGYLKIDGKCTPAISPDGRYVAFAGSEGVSVLDATSAEVQAAQPMPEASEVPSVQTVPFSREPIFAFSPSGARLACMTGSRIFVWDFQTGELRRSLEDMGTAGGHFFWTSEEHLLIGNCLLAGADSSIKLWEYGSPKDAAFCGGMCWFLLRERLEKSETLLPLQIPHPGVKEALERAMQDPDFFLLQPGARVRLDVDGLPDAAEREKAHASLTEKLQANGFQVDPNGEIELVASVERENNNELVVRSSSPFSAPRTYKFQHYLSRLKFIYQAQVIWQVERSNVPDFIDRDLSETVERWLRRQEKPRYDLFQNVHLPKTLIKSNAPGSLGASRVTPRGLEDTSIIPRKSQPAAPRYPR